MTGLSIDRHDGDSRASRMPAGLNGRESKAQGNPADAGAALGSRSMACTEAGRAGRNGGLTMTSGQSVPAIIHELLPDPNGTWLRAFIVAEGLPLPNLSP